MGLMSDNAWVASMLVLQFLGSIYGAYILRDLFRISVAMDVVQRSKRSDSSVHSPESDPLCACVFRKLYTPWQLTMRFTLASVVCLNLYSFLGVFVRILYFAMCDMCTLSATLWFTASSGVLLGYAFMFVVHFERLRLTFKGSALALPRWAPRLLYAALLLYLVLFTAVIAFRYSQPIVSAAAMILVVVEYALSVSYLIRAFYKKTTAVANAAPRDIELLESAVRISIVVVVSLLSTSIALGSWVVILGICPNCHIWELMGNILVTFDLCLNSFCLLCTFASADKQYKAVFGTLHARFVEREASRTETAIKYSDRMSSDRMPSDKMSSDRKSSDHS